MMDRKEYRGFRDLIVYQLSSKLSLEIFVITKSFPDEEKYSLTDQIRRFSKSFISKLVDADGEASETTVWLDYSKDHKYITDEKHNYFITKYDEVSRMLYSMMNSRKSFVTEYFLVFFIF